MNDRVLDLSPPFKVLKIFSIKIYKAVRVTGTLPNMFVIPTKTDICYFNKQSKTETNKNNK